MSDLNKISFQSPDVVAQPLGAYSHLAIVPSGFELLILAGQVGNQIDGTVPPDPEAQYELALLNVVRILESQRLQPTDIVKLNTYLVRPLDLDKFRTIRQSILGSIAPPTTLIYVPRLATLDYLVEVEAWAARRAIA